MFFFQVPIGFHTDLASIPPFFKPVFSTWGKHTAAAIVHDCFYSYQAGKEMADDVFEAVMLMDGVDETAASVMAAAVRVGGSSAYNEKDVGQPDKQVISKDGYWV
jgi:hypothetical protein